ncbi:MAG: rhomboid family intramembrane serine protease [Nitrospirae bacterium]|nr:rhomboid family intramembrane serine protease [Nitrospirota bacterium]MCL5977767.1 rhomboid family intramembrane serine protease [Nitrospirota bacterium]
MIPFKDDNPTQTFPFVTISLIVINCIVFIWELSSPAGIQKIAYFYGAIPHSLISFESVQPVPVAASIFTSIFLHGGFFHLAGNMLYLWIFGNNIEDSVGHFKFFIFYLLSGIIAAYSHALTDAHSTIPMIGASGAVSGILGAYILLFPHARVSTLLFFGFFWQIVRIPAVFVIGFWIVIQVINGLLSKGMLNQGGVAWFAHIGGFLAGLITIKLWLPRKRHEKIYH